MSSPKLARVCLVVIAVFMLPTGLQAGFTPRTFYDGFPFGRSWVPVAGGAYDEHLVRDVGILFLALIIITLWTAWRGANTGIVAFAWLVQGVGHLVFHAGHLDGLDTADRIGLLASLAVVPVLALVALLERRIVGFREPHYFHK